MILKVLLKNLMLIEMDSFPTWTLEWSMRLAYILVHMALQAKLRFQAIWSIGSVNLMR